MSDQHKNRSRGRNAAANPGTPSAPFPTVPAAMEQQQSQLGDITGEGLAPPAHQELATLAGDVAEL